MIGANNLPAIHQKLVQEGKVSGVSAPSADALSYAMQEMSAKSSTSQFYDWLQTLLDVPVDTMGLHASELLNIPAQTGKSPAKYLVDMMREQTPNSTLQTPASVWNRAVKNPWWVWLLLILALIGVFTVAAYTGKLLRKFAE